MSDTSQPDNTPTYGPFAETTPSGQTGWLDESRQPVAEHIKMMLGKLDGTEKYSYSIWRGTNPQSIIVTKNDASETFIQAAGSAEAMTVEVRLRGEDVTTHLYVVGGNQPATDETILLPTSSERAVRVFSNEVFTADEAAELFSEFYNSETVADSYTLRELDLSNPQSEQR